MTGVPTGLGFETNPSIHARHPSTPHAQEARAPVGMAIWE